MKNSISFKSKINFISPEELSKIAKGTKVKYNPTKPCKEAFSYSIRTCTGGGIVDNNKKQIKPFHIFDCKENFKNINKITDDLFNNTTGNRGLLIGANDLNCAEYSKKIFDNIKNNFLNKTKNISVFEEHRFPYSETDYYYNGNTDTWYLSAIYKKPTEIFPKKVLTVDDLRNCYKKITIANGDSLYINDEKIDNI